MSVINKTLSSIFYNKNATKIIKIRNEVVLNFNRIFILDSPIAFSINNSTIFTDQPPLNIQFTKKYKKEFFKKYCHFQPNMSSESILGTITISANIFKKEFPENSTDFIMELLDSQNRNYSINFPVEKRQELALKFSLYHELAHAYQLNLYFQNKKTLNPSIKFQQLGQHIGQKDYFLLTAYHLNDRQKKDINTLTVDHIHQLSQEMYADIFALALMAQEYNYSNITSELHNIVKHSRKNIEIKNKDFYYPRHSTEKAIELFNKNDLKKIIENNSNKSLEDLIHEYVSNIVAEALNNFLNEYIQDLDKNYFKIPEQEQKIKVIKDVLNCSPVNIIKPFDNQNKKVANRVKLIKLTNKKGKRYKLR